MTTKVLFPAVITEGSASFRISRDLDRQVKFAFMNNLGVFLSNKFGQTITVVSCRCECEGLFRIQYDDLDPEKDQEALKQLVVQYVEQCDFDDLVIHSYRMENVELDDLVDQGRVQLWQHGQRCEWITGGVSEKQFSDYALALQGLLILKGSYLHFHDGVLDLVCVVTDGDDVDPYTLGEYNRFYLIGALLLRDNNPVYFGR